MKELSEEFDKLEEGIKFCGDCVLSHTRANALFGEGKRDSRIMLIAQAPGTKEDKEGRMFIGPSGDVLDELLEAAGVGRDDIYMTNLIKCHLPKNRKPKQNEIDTCSRYLTREIELISPEILVPMGYYASRHVLESCGIKALEAKKDSASVFGELFTCESRTVLPLPHPSSVLYERSKMESTRELYGKIGAFWF